MSSAGISSQHKCAHCGEPAEKRCQQCKSTWYCSRDHQVSHWKSHKPLCKQIAADIAQADSHTLHKQEFDRIRIKYGLTTEENAGKIADLLANKGADEGISAPKFAEMFGMSTAEAVVFLEWIKVGVKFKEETLDVAKKSGFDGRSS
ncbi:hypothetical protein ACHAXS_012131 [Conticribra weissflogii]